MKLAIISEGISRADFYDFYALMNAYYSHPERSDIKQRLQFTVTSILSDHLHQLGCIILNRISDPQNAQTAMILRQHQIGDINYKLTGLDKLTITQLADAIAEVRKLNHHFGFTGETWHSLADRFVSLIRTSKNDLVTQIMTLDRIYGWMHHGGLLTDYMDESDWLENALHFKNKANEAQIFAKASPEVRALIGRASYSHQEKQDLNTLVKLQTALDRAAPWATTSLTGGTLRIAYNYRQVLYREDATETGYTVFTGKDMGLLQKKIDDGTFVLGDKKQVAIEIKEIGNDLQLTSDGTVAIVEGPFNRLLRLAQDLIACKGFVQALSGRCYYLIDKMPAWSSLPSRRRK